MVSDGKGSSKQVILVHVPGLARSPGIDQDYGKVCSMNGFESHLVWDPGTYAVGTTSQQMGRKYGSYPAKS